MTPALTINHRPVGSGHPVYIIAEMSANHHQNFDQAVKIIEAAKAAGADAVKLQTYTPETITIDCDTEYFRIKGTIWEGKNLYELYGEAFTPWEWQPKLKAIADKLGIALFSTPFDPTAVDFLEKMDVPAYKVASFELVDLPLLSKIARTGKPIIMSAGMATLAEIDEAVRTIRRAGGRDLALLKCVSAYPAPPEETHLRTIAHLSETFGLPAGLSDHTLGIAVPVAAAALGASIIEKHVTLSRSTPGPDSPFSLEPSELAEMVAAIRTAEKAVGRVCYDVTDAQKASRVFRRSLFAVADIAAGERFTKDNVRSIRPGNGLHPRYLDTVLQRRARVAITRGTPLSFDLLA